jgi:hypothetical protein
VTPNGFVIDEDTLLWYTPCQPVIAASDIGAGTVTSGHEHLFVQGVGDSL